MKNILILLAMVIGMVTEDTEAVDITKLNQEDLLYIDLEAGRIVILTMPQVAPNHVNRVKELARQGFYDGTVFHRVIPGFMAQGGDPTATGTGGSGQNIDAEFSRVPHMRGTVSMARAEDENSADSQFFICFDRTPFLDNNYTAWGRVVSGMAVADQIAPGEPPRNPTKIVKMGVMADLTD
jgi:peptidylprolyl isomerase